MTTKHKTTGQATETKIKMSKGHFELLKFAHCTHKSFGIKRKFDFRVVTEDADCSNPCGTAGCKLGTLPFFTGDYFLAYYSCGDLHVNEERIYRYFDLIEEEHDVLFLPNMFHTRLRQYVLPRSAKESQVNKNIIKFLTDKYGRETIKRYKGKITPADTCSKLERFI